MAVTKIERYRSLKNWRLKCSVLQIDIDEVSSPINFYYDDNQDLFLTDFDEEEKVLELPIHLIAIGEEVVTV